MSAVVVVGRWTRLAGLGAAALLVMSGCAGSDDGGSKVAAAGADAAGVDGGLAAGDASVPSTCVKNKQFCVGNEIWGCDAAGKPTQPVKTCAVGEVCAIDMGVAVCKQADAADVTDAAAGSPDSEAADAGSDAGEDAPAPSDALDNDVAADTAAPDAAEPADVAQPDAVVDAEADVAADTAAPDAVEPADVAQPDAVADAEVDVAADTVVNDVVEPADVAQPDVVADAEGDVAADTAADALADATADAIADTQADVIADVIADSAGDSLGDSLVDSVADSVSDSASDSIADSVSDSASDSIADSVSDSASDSVADTATAKTCKPGIAFCDGTVIRYCNSNGTWGSVKTTCAAGKVCGVEGNAAVCIAGSYNCIGDVCTCTPMEPDQCVKVVKPNTTKGYVYAVKSRLACYENTTLSECKEFNSCVEGQCTSSVLDKTSPYWDLACDLSQYLLYKTSLPADCRCATNQANLTGIGICKRPYEANLQGLSFGSGPKVAGLPQVAMGGGYIDTKTDEIITAVSWSGSTDRKGLILGVEVKTGKRRVLSGTYQEAGGPASVGTGPALLWPVDVQAGPDGKLLAIANAATAAPEIVSIDPVTGNRTLLWRGGDAAFGQCPSSQANTAVQTNPFGFAVDTDGSMLVGYSNALTDGRGIVRISANGKTCTSVTGSGSKNGAIDKGTGNALGGFVQGFAIRDGKVWALTTQPKALWSIDLATGNRTQVFTAVSASAMGERRIAWDEARKLWWIAGVQNSTTISAFEPVAGALYNVDVSCGGTSPFKLCWGGPININTLNYGGMYVHPTNGRVYFGHDAMSITEVEVETGNSIVLSL